MPHELWCGNPCSECTNQCATDMSIPCSSDCENLTANGMIKVAQCLKSGCEEVRYIFDMLGKTDEEIIARYGEVAPYPY